MAKSLSTLRSNINTFTGDASNVIWTAAQKNLAVNLAIQSAWPEIKTTGFTSFALADGSYTYHLPVNSALAFTRAPYGPQQVWCATSTSTDTAVYREMRRSVRAIVSCNEWYLEFDPDWVDNHDGYMIEVNYNQQYAELGSDSATTDVPEAYINPRALFELCGMMALKGHHTDVATFAKQKPDFYEEAEREKRRHRTEALATTIKVRWE